MHARGLREKPLEGPGERVLHSPAWARPQRTAVAAEALWRGASGSGAGAGRPSSVTLCVAEGSIREVTSLIFFFLVKLFNFEMIVASHGCKK